MTPEERLVQRLLLAVYDYQVEASGNAQLLVAEEADIASSGPEHTPTKLREIVKHIARDKQRQFRQQANLMRQQRDSSTW